jgi:RNA polymerase sigma-70 factor (ECF subfamily)
LAGPEPPQPPDFGEFYQATYGRTLALITALTGNRSEAEDVTQEAFARALARWNRLRNYDLPEAWVRRVALRLATDAGRRLWRARRVSTKLSAQRPDPPARPDDAIEFADLGQALRRLPFAQREILVLHYLADLSVEQIAADRGLSTGTVKTRLVSGRRRLERELATGPKAVRDARQGSARGVRHLGRTDPTSYAT